MESKVLKTPEEKLSIANICARYKGILENKKTDQVSCHQKNSTWDKIAKEVNASCISGIHRSKEVLKRFYENRKREVRKIAAEEKREIFATGGGKPCIPKKDPCHDVFLSVMNNKTIYGLDCDVGGDVENVHLGDITQITPFNVTWQKYTPVDLLNPVSEALVVAEKKSEQPGCSKENDSTPLTTSERPEVIPNARKRKYEGVSQNTPSSSRRRPQTIVKALTRTDFAEKYSLLIDRRLALIDKQEEKVNEEILAIQEEGVAKARIFQLDIEIREEQLKKLKQIKNV